MEYTSPFKVRLIYVMRINDAAHKGCLKIGETTLKDNITDPQQLQVNSTALKQAARKRINEYTNTAAIPYDLLHAETTLFIQDGKIKSFNDKHIHNILLRSGIEKKCFDLQNNANEWFIVDLETVKRAIEAAKQGWTSLTPNDISTDRNPIVLRPEQIEAIEKTKIAFQKKNKKQFLWNAKMRFGKTLSALQLIKEMGFNRSIIVTHRPVVDDSWFTDFGNIFYDTKDFIYGSRDRGEQIKTLLSKNLYNGKKIIYFASMQDLRGSKKVGGNFDKNEDIFSTSWDLLIIDEAHEGTQTDLGQKVIKLLFADNTKKLDLSGTPYNLMEDYDMDSRYTWDYTMEQRTKQQWAILHPGDNNPYEVLPRMNIFTYDLGLELREYQDAEHVFNFTEFFRTNEQGGFVHSEDIDHFLNLLCKPSKSSKYPFSTPQWREYFRHSLWMLPGVKEAKALSEKLQQHSVFGQFDIVNVAGEGDDDAENEDALQMVRKAIGQDAEQTWTITLSCGRLTTGVTIPQWTAVFMLAGSYSTSAQSYMQTIFRVQSPYTLNGKLKEECFVFDFAPDRTLKVLANTAKISSKAGGTSGSDRDILGEFLNFCPIISYDGSQMEAYNVDNMLQQLKRAYVDRVVKNGFEDMSLYGQNISNLDKDALAKFKNLQEIIGTTKAMKKTQEIIINNQGLDNDEKQSEVKPEPAKKQKTEQQKKHEEELKNRRTAFSILCGISIRMPMILYGADIDNEDEQITLDNFTNLVDDQSWEEFMPKGVTKELFEDFKQYYDPDIFTAAGKRIREITKLADAMDIEERIQHIANIFSSFRNPDKETVLTPWRVVNMHMNDTLGGYTFFNEDFSKEIATARHTDQGEVTQNVFHPNSKILEINSKSGLYPLYIAYNLYRVLLKNSHPSEEDLQSENPILSMHQRLWDKVLKDNLFIICKTPMAKHITRRTLCGFRHQNTNTRYFEDIVGQITFKKEKFLSKIINGQDFWRANNNKTMEFNAIVGNPPYQENISNSSNNAGLSKQLFPYFIQTSILLNPDYATLITPSRWFAGDAQDGSFVKLRKFVKNNLHFEKIYHYINEKELFNNVEIKGG